VKHEFSEGQIYGMAGGTPEHAALKAAVIGVLLAQIQTGREPSRRRAVASYLLESIGAELAVDDVYAASAER